MLFRMIGFLVTTFSPVYLGWRYCSKRLDEMPPQRRREFQKDWAPAIGMFAVVVFLAYASFMLALWA